MTATDISPRAIDKARALAARRGVALDARLADLDDWAWPESAFDEAVAIFVQFSPPPARDLMFRRIVSALRPGGLLMLQGYRPEQIAFGTGGPGQVENLYTEALLRNAFAGLDILHLESHDSELAEGPGHAGRSALIDLVARRS